MRNERRDCIGQIQGGQQPKRGEAKQQRPDQMRAS